MEYDIDPVYINDIDVNSIHGNVVLKTCYAVQNLFPGEIHGAQRLNNHMKIYLRSEVTRAALVVRGIDIDNKHISVHDTNPTHFANNKSERVLIKDLPLIVPPTKVMTFLKGLPHITVRSKVIYAKERTSGDEMSPFLNGDRIVYISPNVTPPLPKESVIGGYPCRIWHASQKNFCKRCAEHGHRTTDIAQCEAYDADAAVVAFRSDSNPLSNFYRCTLISGEFTLTSAEHFYQFEKCMHCDRPDLAQQVVEAPTPKLAKQIATSMEVHPDYMASWDIKRFDVMQRALKLKWNSCAKFRNSLMATHGQTIAEATQDAVWGVGVAPNLAQQTKPAKFLGANHLGRLLMSLRDYVARTEPQFHNLTFSPTGSTKVDLPDASSYSTTESETSSSSMDLETSPNTTTDSDPVESSKHVNTDLQPTTPTHSPVTETPTSSNSTAESKSSEESTSSTESETSPTITSDNDSTTNNGENLISDSNPPTTAHPPEAKTPSPKNCPMNRPAAGSKLSDSTSTLDNPTVSNSDVQSAITPARPPRRAKRLHTLTNGSKQRSTATLDKFVTVTKDSPGTKRKLSDGTLSPSSVQNAKTNRRDVDDDKVS